MTQLHSADVLDLLVQARLLPPMVGLRLLLLQLVDLVTRHDGVRGREVASPLFSGLPEELGSEVLPPLHLRPFQGGLLPHVDQVELVLLEESGHRDVQEVQLAEDVGDVELVGDLVDGLLELLDLRPVGLAADQVQHELDVVGQEGDDVEGPGSDLFVVVVHQYFVGETDLVGLFSVLPHEEDETNNGAHKPSYIREILVNFIE